MYFHCFFRHQIRGCAIFVTLILFLEFVSASHVQSVSLPFALCSSCVDALSVSPSLLRITLCIYFHWFSRHQIRGFPYPLSSFSFRVHRRDSFTHVSLPFSLHLVMCRREISVMSFPVRSGDCNFHKYLKFTEIFEFDIRLRPSYDLVIPVLNNMSFVLHS